MAGGVAWTDRALILGGAETLWDDVDGALQLTGGAWPGRVVAVNEAGVHWEGDLHHWVSYHPEHMQGWAERRAANGYRGDFTTWARRMEPWVDRQAPHWDGGSSGLLAVAVCHELGMERVILCGVPIERRPHFHDRDDGRPWKYADTHWRKWKKAAPKMAGWVRSMSGRTRDLLGEPTTEWLTS